MLVIYSSFFYFLFVLLMLTIFKTGNKCFSSIKLEVSIDGSPCCFVCTLHVDLRIHYIVSLSDWIPPILIFAVPFRRHFQKFLKATLGNNSTKS